jgi:hypothetical protein
LKFAKPFAAQQRPVCLAAGIRPPSLAPMIFVELRRAWLIEFYARIIAKQCVPAFIEYAESARFRQMTERLSQG